MRRPPPWFVALLLALIWLPATQHCALEAAGILGAHADDSSHANCSGDASRPEGDCEIVEGGAIDVSGVSVKVIAPEMQAWGYFVLVELIAPAGAECPVELATHLQRAWEWFPTRHVDRRAALPPRAPALIAA